MKNAALRLLAGIALLPVSWGIARGLLDLVYVLPANGEGTSGLMALVGGYFAWLAVCALLPAPVRAYVFAHELTHALWGLLWGARPRNLRVTKRGGSVTLSHTNCLILLAPYFFPLYTMLLLTGQSLAGIFVDTSRHAAFWLAALGFTWGFHFTFTLRGLLQRQSDIVACGRVFSYALILSLNLLGIGLWLAWSTNATIEMFLLAIIRRSTETIQCFVP